MHRDSFVFYRSFFDAIEALPKSKQLEVYRAIAMFALDGAEPQISGISAAIFSMARPSIEKNQKKYENGCKGAASGFLGAEYGKRGGRPRKITPQETPQETRRTTPQKPPYNDTVTETVTDTEEKEKDKKENQQEPQSDVAETLHQPEHAAKFRQWLAVWKETHGGGKDMPRFRQEAQVRLLLTMPPDLRSEAIERAILGGWKALHDTRVMRQEENSPGKLPRDYFTNGKNIPTASEYGTRCDEV